MDLFLQNCRPLLFPPSRPWDECTVPRFSFSKLMEMIHTDFPGLPPALSWFHWLFRTPGSLIQSGSGLLGQCVSFSFQPLILSSSLDYSGEGPDFISPLAAHSTTTGVGRGGQRGDKWGWKETSLGQWVHEAACRCFIELYT